MNRRLFVVALAGGFLAPAARIAAQAQRKPHRIGLLSSLSHDDMVALGRYDAFVRGMRELGYVQGRDYVIEGRYDDGSYQQLPAMADELVRLKVDIIVAAASPAIRAAQKATSTIPIVFPSTGDPVGSGFAATLAKPGGNLTGISNSGVDLAAKLVELLKTMAPATSRVALLTNPGSSSETAMIDRLSAAARKVEVQTFVVEARTPQEIERAFEAMRSQRADALIVAADSFLSQQGPQIAELALRARLPSITQSIRYARSGGLMGYGSTTQSWHRAASYVDKILRGAKPGDLPIEQPTTMQLSINRKTADALGLRIPAPMALLADEIIE